MKEKHHIKPFEYDDDKYDNGYHDNLIEKRKTKRLKNAIKAKNVIEVMDIDEGTYYY